jgi:pimeloyl-ACP methyl ester carboxylesterase
MKFQVANHSAYAYTGTKPLTKGAPTIVMVHGAQHDHSVWILQSRYFAHHGYNVLAVDLPGHGKSDGAPLTSVQAIGLWLATVAKTLDLIQCHWVGHSMGSLAVLEAAALTPELTKSVVLIGTAFPMRVSDVLLAAAKNDEPEAFAMINLWSHSSLAHHPGSPGPGFSVFNQNRRLMERQAKGVLLNDFSACNSYENGLIAAQSIQAPVHFISGQSDQMTPPKASNALFDSFKASTRDIIPYCGHAVMAERPDRVLTSLKNHLKRF